MMKNKSELNVQVDYHESTSRQNKAAKRWNTTVEELPIGDFVCEHQVAVEYKTMPDFISSVMDGRLKEESLNQMEVFPHHYVMVEGNIDATLKQLRYTNVSFTKNQYNGAITSLLQYTKVIHATNEHHAFELMDSLFHKCLDGKDRTIHKVTKYGNNPCLNYIASIPQIGEDTASWIVNQYEPKKLSDLLDIGYDELTNVKGISDKKANKIIEYLK